MTGFVQLNYCKCVKKLVQLKCNINFSQNLVYVGVCGTHMVLIPEQSLIEFNQINQKSCSQVVLFLHNIEGNSSLGK